MCYGGDASPPHKLTEEANIPVANVFANVLSVFGRARLDGLVAEETDGQGLAKAAPKVKPLSELLRGGFTASAVRPQVSVPEVADRHW